MIKIVSEQELEPVVKAHKTFDAESIRLFLFY